MKRGCRPPPVQRIISLIFCLVLNPVLTQHMYCRHDMSKSSICLFSQIIIFYAQIGRVNKHQYSHFLKTSTLRNPRILNI